jgi:hypothetical protein
MTFLSYVIKLFHKEIGPRGGLSNSDLFNDVIKGRHKLSNVMKTLQIMQLLR